MPTCRAAAWVLRLSLARRSASALNASSYLRRLSGDAPLDFAAITEELYVLLLSVFSRPPQLPIGHFSRVPKEELEKVQAELAQARCGASRSAGPNWPRTARNWSTNTSPILATPSQLRLRRRESSGIWPNVERGDAVRRIVYPSSVRHL